MKQVLVSEDLLRQALQAHTAMRDWIKAVPDDIQLPAMPGVDGDWLDDVQAALTTALAPTPSPVQEPEPSNVQAQWLGSALFDCIKASGIIRKDIGSLSVAELLFFSKDLKGMLERHAAPQAATGHEPSDAQIALLDPWMRPAAAKELLTKVLSLSPTTP